MTYNETLQTNNSRIQALIDTANELPDASSGGGAPSTIVAGDTPVLSSSVLVASKTSSTISATGISITIPIAGTYRFKFSCARTSTSGTWTTQLYRNGTAISGATATWLTFQGTYTGDIKCAAGDVIEIYAMARSSSYRNVIGQLVACIDWDNGFEQTIIPPETELP